MIGRTNASKKVSNVEQNIEDENKVVLEHKLLRVEEVFVYQVPPLKTSDGHRAEDWNLANPAATCALNVIQRNSDLLIRLMGKRPKLDGPPGSTEEHLFAQCKVCYDGKHKVEYWVESVVDSSRYFVIRCEDENSRKQAFVGVGFRERDEALSLKMCLSDYIRSVDRENKALDLMTKKVEQDQLEEVASENDNETCASLSKLSFKEGEKIHINIRGNPEKKSPKGKRLRNSSGGLRPPPPPAGSNVASGKKNSISEQMREVTTSKTEEDSAPEVRNAEIDDDDWGDFESGV
mmetsp:Transcript_61807/g.74365  ORF Transcript_61807/g.74365 Transcript_61807/m.74365 type:complete len:291 (-) Transcript_61807:469-1341(-)